MTQPVSLVRDGISRESAGNEVETTRACLGPALSRRRCLGQPQRNYGTAEGSCPAVMAADGMESSPCICLSPVNAWMRNKWLQAAVVRQVR